MATHAARAVEWPSGSLRQNSPNQESSKSEHGEMFLFVRYRTRGGNSSLIFTNAQILSKQLLELSLDSLEHSHAAASRPCRSRMVIWPFL